jgi:hypothetical protein
MRDKRGKGMRLKVITALLVCCLLAASKGLAETVTFDNLPAVSCIPSKTISNGYDGFNWSNFGYDKGTVAPCSAEGYGTALTSGTNVGFNKEGDPASITSATPFTVQSGVFAAAFNDGLTVTVTGIEGGVTVGTESFVLNTTTAALEIFSFGPVTELDFSASGGAENPSLVMFGGGTEFAVDNLVVTPLVTVPEPSSLVLLSAGVAAAEAVRRRLSKGKAAPRKQ